MSREVISRRRFLTLPLALGLAPWSTVWGEIRSRRGTYSADVGILYDLISLRLTGTVDEVLDPVAGHYEVKAVGEGAGIANRVESSGRLYDGRWTPLKTTSWFQVRGREARSEVLYDHDHHTIDYHFRGETFFLRRLRVVDDRLQVPPGVHVDDVISALFNYVEGQWKPQPDGAYHTLIVRRSKRESEGTDDVDPNARAELVPFDLRITADEATGKPAAIFDMTRFSSWARADRPARILFGANRRPELITSTLILGTSITIRLRDV